MLPVSMLRWSSFIGRLFMAVAVACTPPLAVAQQANGGPEMQADTTSIWPEGVRAALSLSFDDARPTQLDEGIPLFESFGAQVTFYVVPSNLDDRLQAWKRAAEHHEIGNHSLNHPCSGNFAWSRERALEGYTLEQMRDELVEANDQIESLLGTRPETFAYPCGQTFVGRGTQTASYVPIVAKLFLAGRGWLDESSNDPLFVDLAQVMAISMDNVTFEDLKPFIDAAREAGTWIVLAGHDIGHEGGQTTLIPTLEQLIHYAQDPVNELWLAPVGTVARHLRDRRAVTDY